MNRPFYTECVRHCMRFYSRNQDLSYFKTRADMENWLACKKALELYSDERDTLLRVYGMPDTLADNVYEVSQALHIDQNIIWDLLKRFERDVAVMRGLL